MKVTHELAHCMFEGGANACPDGLGAFFSNGQDFDKGGGGDFKRFLGSAQMDRTLLKKGFPQSLFLHLLPYHLNAFSVLCKSCHKRCHSGQWPMTYEK